MYSFQVKDMTCGHCVATVEKAIKSVDGRAQVDINLQTSAVNIQSDIEPTRFAEAIAEAGYTGELQAA
ncbi:MAG: heavy-metal-associated domain-containing protein [Alphaproteobacteria bacterium]|nr:heavy-metal-associated domain-containing protein [Alphaproteobacteria bacterium]